MRFCKRNSFAFKEKICRKMYTEIPANASKYIKLCYSGRWAFTYVTIHDVLGIVHDEAQKIALYQVDPITFERVCDAEKYGIVCVHE